MKTIKAVNAPSFVRHLETLSKLAGVDYPYPFDIYEKLCRIENKANRTATKDCNGELSEEQVIKADELTRKAVTKLLPNLNPQDWFINGDPRGYTLKIREEKAQELNMWTDWGGYGILAPEF